MAGEAVFAIGFLPFMLILGAFLVMGTIFFFLKLTASVITELLLAMGTIWLIIVLVMAFVANFCLSISPVERFKGKHYDTFTDFSDAVAATEETVCKMIDDVEKFIKSKNMSEDSSTDAAKQSVDGPVTTCPAPVHDSIEDRLTRMERTLQQFIEPELKQTYESSVPCEPFVSDAVDRLDAIRRTIHTLNVKYLNPIKQKQEDLRRGHISDCDKKRGAMTAIKGA